MKKASLLTKKVLFLQRKKRGSLAQLVQSIALTRRGSLVRVQQFPQNLEITCWISAGYFFMRFGVPFDGTNQCTMECSELW